MTVQPVETRYKSAISVVGVLALIAIVLRH